MCLLLLQTASFPASSELAYTVFVNGQDMTSVATDLTDLFDCEWLSWWFVSALCTCVCIQCSWELCMHDCCLLVRTLQSSQLSHGYLQTNSAWPPSSFSHYCRWLRAIFRDKRCSLETYSHQFWQQRRLLWFNLWTGGIPPSAFSSHQGALRMVAAPQMSAQVERCNEWTDSRHLPRHALEFDVREWTVEILSVPTDVVVLM